MLEKSRYEQTPPSSASVQTLPANDTAIVKESSPMSSSVIGANMVFRGELMAGDDIVIHGTFEGIARHTKSVVVGKAGRVRAMIHATRVTVRGYVDGDIYGDDVVELMDGSRVDGDIYCPSLKVESGASFNGSVKMA